MREIKVSTDTFAAIWRVRIDGEDSEDAILSRILSSVVAPRSVVISEKVDEDTDVGKIRWVDDVVTALRRLGGVADLNDIYRLTRKIRTDAGRSLPRTLDATIRRTLEDHSSDSANFRGKNLFKLVGRGRWALR